MQWPDDLGDEVRRGVINRLWEHERTTGCRVVLVGLSRSTEEKDLAKVDVAVIRPPEKYLLRRPKQVRLHEQFPAAYERRRVHLDVRDISTLEANVGSPLLVGRELLDPSLRGRLAGDLRRFDIGRWKDHVVSWKDLSIQLEECIFGLRRGSHFSNHDDEDRRLLETARILASAICVSRLQTSGQYLEESIKAELPVEIHPHFEWHQNLFEGRAATPAPATYGRRDRRPVVHALQSWIHRNADRIDQAWDLCPSFALSGLQQLIEGTDWKQPSAIAGEMADLAGGFLPVIVAEPVEGDPEPESEFGL